MAYDFYRSGDWNATCEICGFKYKASMLRDRWDGVKVCYKCWEPRHPQDFVRGTKDNMSVPWARDPIDVFVGPMCDLVTSSPFAGYGEAGCMIAGKVIPPLSVIVSLISPT